MWDKRYDTDDFVYGTEPNEFLVSATNELPRGATLCLGEGEGRNAVFLAERGHRVIAVDASAVGLAKARRLAELHGVMIETVVRDLAEYEIGVERWDMVVSIFCHVPPALRKELHRRVVVGLRPGGVLVLEAYTPRQLNYRTGGPPSKELMMTLAGLTAELEGLHFRHAVETERTVVEGILHTGKAAVVQIVAIKP